VSLCLPPRLRRAASYAEADARELPLELELLVTNEPEMPFERPVTVETNPVHR
jgi:hypothetical protein